MFYQRVFLSPEEETTWDSSASTIPRIKSASKDTRMAVEALCFFLDSPPIKKLVLSLQHGRRTKTIDLTVHNGYFSMRTIAGDHLRLVLQPYVVCLSGFRNP